MDNLPSIGPYLLHRRIAKGGMAEVYLASRGAPGGPDDRDGLVALKCIRPEFADDPSFGRMFLDEATITSRLRHDNITQLLDFGQHGATPYLVMEFIDGASVKQIVKRGPLPPALAARIGAGIAAALHAAHEQRDEKGESLGIVHRDVTPQNVMVTFEGRVKLLDFGIALTRVRAERTRTGVLKGKWAYMSPEQVQGKGLDRRSDIFSLGALLHEMATGTRAFDGESPSEVLGGVMLRQPPRLATRVPGAPPELQAVVSRCLEKEPRDRYQTAAEVRADLERVVAALDRERVAEPLAAFVRRVLPDLFEQVSSTRREILESRLGGLRPDPEEDPTVVQAAPFEQMAGDFEESAPPASPGCPDGVGAPRSEPELEPERERLALKILLTMGLGVGVGVALAVIVWRLGIF